MRHISIDVLRAAAICLMIVVHFAENLSGSTVSGWLPGGMAAPIFTLLAGVSFRLWLRGQESQGVHESTITKRAVRRGLFLFGLGVAFNVLVWMPEDTFNWDVLTLVGSATLFLTVARHQSPAVLALTAVAVFVAHPFLRESLEFSTYWTDGYFDPDMTLSDVLFGYFANGYFPIFPWIIYPVTGFVAADVVFPAAGATPVSQRPLLCLGTTLAASGLLAMKLRVYTSEQVQKHLLQGWTMFPPSVEYVCWTLGFAILAIVFAHRWLDNRKWLTADSRLGKIAKTLSRHSLSIYLLHHVVHLWPLWVYSIVAGHEATHYWRLALPDTISIPLALVCVAFCYGLLRWLERREYPTIETLMRWLCD
ncbi:MAG: hypothetical protein RLY70_3855 [Planctomycetota bacterium]|jgi:uncharacterized membrane protein